MKKFTSYLRFTFILCLLICTAKRACSADLSINFLPYFQQEKLLLKEKEYSHTNAESIRFSNLKCYVGQLRIQYTDGSFYEDAIPYHLLDYSEPTTMQLSLTGVPEKRISAINFAFGVDSSVNVQGAMGGDLDPVKGMYWAWNSGYINLKIEGSSNVCTTHDHSFELHIGGFQAPYATQRVIQLPINQNSVQDSILVKMDIARFLNGIDLSRVNSIVMPGKAAAEVAARSVDVFSILPKQ